MAAGGRTVRLHGALPAGGAELVPGRDLLLPDDPAAAEAPAGTLLHDWLDPTTRRGAQEDADRAMAAWRDRVDGALSPEGICLPAVFAGHLQADAFLSVTRIAAAIPAFVAAERPSRAELHAVEPQLAEALATALAGLGVSASIGPLAPPPSYPIALARSVRSSRLTPLREALGMPGRPRGTALIQPFRNLSSLWSALPARGIEPVLDPFLPPALPPRELAARVVSGGFIGHPGAGARRRSRALLRQTLAAVAEPARHAGDPLAALAERRALEVLRQLAGDTMALAGVFRAAVRRGVRTAVVPSDTAPYARTFAAATRELGGTLVRVQHGFYSDLWRLDGALVPYVDGLEAERVAVWAPRDAERLKGVARGEVSVTGNPGAAELEGAGGDGTAAVVLLQSASPDTLSFDVRASRRYAGEALAGLAAAGFRGPVILRPHPLDRSDYSRLAAGTPRASVRSGGSLAAVLARARLCVGTLSTGTLEAVASGVPTVFLDVSSAALPWPFDGSGALPRATDGASLADVLQAIEAPAERARAAAREALGARPDAVERVVDLIADAVA